VSRLDEIKGHIAEQDEGRVCPCHDWRRQDELTAELEAARARIAELEESLETARWEASRD
jgi:hypothetical protein